jgi:hypothetical protein
VWIKPYLHTPCMPSWHKEGQLYLPVLCKAGNFKIEVHQIWAVLVICGGGKIWNKGFWVTYIAAGVGRLPFLEVFKTLTLCLTVIVSMGSLLRAQNMWGGVIAQADGECRYACISVVFLKTWVCVLFWVHQFYSIYSLSWLALVYIVCFFMSLSGFLTWILP